MDTDSSENSALEKFEVPVHSSDTDESYKDAVDEIAHINFDDLKNDQFATTQSNHSEKDQISLHSSNDDAQNRLEESECEDAPKMLKLVPIESLLKTKHVSKDECDAIQLSSESSSDNLLVELAKPKSKPKKKYTKTRRKSSNHQNYTENSTSDSSNDSDSDVPIATISRKYRAKPKSKRKSTNDQPQNMYGARVELIRLPLNMEPLLEKYDLIEICDRHHNVIASRPHRNEVHELISILVQKLCFLITKTTTIRYLNTI